MKRLIAVAAFAVTGLFSWAGAPTLETIVVNGNMTDWTAVLQNPNNVTLDGASASDCANSADRDCPVQSTGRDMLKFAWTYDTDNIYLYVERVGSSTNIQNFFFIMDLAQDKKADSTDLVLHVSFQGSTKNTDLTLYRYDPLEPGGDSLTDASGLIDGYDMPGSLSVIPAGDPHYFSVTGLKAGNSTGSAFESYVPWAKVGAAYGTPIFYHVSSGNNASLSQVDDNLGGPGGGIGAFAYYWIQLWPDSYSSVSPGTQAAYVHTVKNNGSFDDTADFYAESSSGVPLSIYWDDTLIATDATGNGSFADAGDYLAPGHDSNSDGRPDMALSPWTIRAVSLVADTSGVPPGCAEISRLHAVSAGDGSGATVTDTTYVGEALLYPDRSVSISAGETAVLEHTLFNGRAGDRFELSLQGTQGYSVSLYLGSVILGTDHDSDGNWDVVDPAFDADLDGAPDLFLDQNGSVSLSLAVSVPPGAVLGTVDQIDLFAGAFSNGSAVSASDMITIRASLTLTPSYSMTEGTEKYGAAGTSVFFPHKLQNNSGSTARFTFRAAGYEPFNSSSWQMTVWSDPDGDGKISDGADITFTDEIPAMGGESYVVVQVQIPPSVTPPASSDALVTAVRCLASDCSSWDPAVTASTEDDLRVSYIVPYADEIFSMQENHFAPCRMIHCKAYNVVPNQAGRYSLIVRDPLSNEVRNVVKITDASGSFTDSFSLEAVSQPGTYRLVLQDDGVVIDDKPLYIEKNGTVSVSAEPLGRTLSSPLVMEAVLGNQNPFAPIVDGSVFFLVRNEDGTLYLKDDGSWGSYSEGWYTRLVGGVDTAAGDVSAVTCGFAGVSFPSYGPYSLCSYWDLSCGSETSSVDDIAFGCSTFYVVRWESYEDEEATIPKSMFPASGTVYFSGEGYEPSAYHSLALYAEGGELLSFADVQADSAGNLKHQFTASSLGDGSFHMVVFPQGSFAPAYSSSMAHSLAEKDFTVFSISLLRNGEITSLNPVSPPLSSIFVQAYPLYPALSGTDDLEKGGFAPGDTFPHETTDLGESVPLVFYELAGVPGDSLRVSIEDGKIKVIY